MLNKKKKLIMLDYGGVVTDLEKKRSFGCTTLFLLSG